MNLVQIYSIPTWSSEYPDFQRDREKFLQIIEEVKLQNESVKRSNIFGYQSGPDLHFIEDFKPLFNYVCHVATSAMCDLDFIHSDIAITASWFTINDSRQCMMNEHTHEHTFSGVFYLKAPPNSGKLVIRNPFLTNLWNGTGLASQKNQFTSTSIKLEPVEGDVILFPSYLPHSVETNDHDDERISISFNIIALPKGMMQNTSDE